MTNFKNIIIFILSATMLCACSNDFLERHPLDEISPQTVFSSESDFEAYTDGLYRMLDGGSRIYGETSDNIIKVSLNKEVLGSRVVPTTDSKWSWTRLRDINFLLNSENAKNFHDEEIRDKYFGIARFFRAYFYFQKVRYYGDVPWYNEIIGTDNTDLLYKARDPRVLVMDSVLADINFAIEHLESSKSVERITKWTALALKSRICLFEGTFRKYHAEFELPGAERFLQESVGASQELINSGAYKVYETTSGPTGNPYQDLFAQMNADNVMDELIMTRRYDRDLGIEHDLQFYLTSRTYGRPGLEKDLVNSYLMSDGTRFTDIPRYDTLEFYEEVQNRDPRLFQTIVTPGSRRIGSGEIISPSFESSTTGYRLLKYLNDPIYDLSGQSSQDLPLFRYGEVLLNFAEAKAELGSLTQEDLDNSVNLLRDRVNMPHMQMSEANANPDPFLASKYINVKGVNSGVILEIRRERRVELVMELNFRWDDLMRWKEAHLLTAPFRGMYFPGEGEYDLDRDGSVDVIVYSGEAPPSVGPYLIPLSELSEGTKGNVLPNKGVTKVFDERKDYLWPLPSEDLTLNSNLEQNPYWD